MTTLAVVCPDGVAAGELLNIEHDGATLEVAVPEGCAPGDTFHVELAAPAAAFDGLSAEHADALRNVLLAIEDSAEIDEFCNTNCYAFNEYVDEEREQRLEWTVIHQQYVKLTEGVIEAALAQTGATSADLFAVLRDYRGRGADAFLRRFIALEDYEMYCEFMAEWSTLSEWQRKHVDKSMARRAIEMIGRQIQPI